MNGRGLLVTEAALARAESECAADALERARSRERAARIHAGEDIEFVAALTGAILPRHPGIMGNGQPNGLTSAPTHVLHLR